MDCSWGAFGRRGVVEVVEVTKERRKRRKNYSILKHFDFLLLDFICIEAVFLLACQIRFQTFFGLQDKYFFMAGIICVAFIVIVMFWNIYSGILRRNFLSEIKSVFALIAGIFVFRELEASKKRRSH